MPRISTTKPLCTCSGDSSGRLQKPLCTLTTYGKRPLPKLLLLHWHSHLFQSRLGSHHVLGLLLLCIFVVESLGVLKVIMTFLLFHAIVWFVGLKQCAISIAPIFCVYIFVLRHGDAALKNSIDHFTSPGFAAEKASIKRVIQQKPT